MVATAALLVAAVVALALVEPDDGGSLSPAASPSVEPGQIESDEESRPPPALRTTAVYRGLGAWIDAYDFVPVYHTAESGPLLVPEDLDAFVERGVMTVYIQAVRLDERSPEGIVDHDLVGRFLRGARERGMRVVGWYLPKFGDVEVDLARLRMIRDFEYEGHRFDGIGVDIEFRGAVPNDAERNQRLVELSRRLRQEVGTEALAAIVLPPVLIEVVHPGYWPNFPWAELSSVYDVWMPMAYWTDVKARTGYRNGHRFTAESIARLRANLGNAAAQVHPIGGVANLATDEDYQGFVQAAGEHGAIGLSMYDYTTTTASGWQVLHNAARTSGEAG